MVFSKNFRVLLTLFTLFFMGSVSQNFAAAASTDEVTSVSGAMCNGYRIFNGPIGKTMALFAIVALGVGFFLGKVSWGTAIAIALGVGALFGAPTLVSLLTGGNKICTQDQTDTAGAYTTQ